MIRKQNIAISVQQQALHALRQRRTESDSDLQRWRSLCRESEHYLWLQLTAGHEISLDRLNLARLRHSEQQSQCARAEHQFKQLSMEVEQLAKALAYAEKALEKFVELFTKRQREARGEMQRIEWQALDEWAVNTNRQRA